MDPAPLWALENMLVKEAGSRQVKADYEGRPQEGEVMYNWRGISEGVVRKVARRLQEKCGYREEYVNDCRLAAELGIVDEQTQREIGSEIGGLRKAMLVAIQQRQKNEKNEEGMNEEP